MRIDPGDVRFVHLMHHRTDTGRIAIFFEATRWTGEPMNTEPGKCAGWKWFPLNALPEQMIVYAEQALKHYADGWTYAERGWL